MCDDEGLAKLREGVGRRETEGCAERPHECLAFCHRRPMREEPLVLGLRHALLFGCTVDFLRRLHEAEAAGRLRDADGDGDGHVVAGRTGAAGFGLPDGAGHVYAPLTAVRHAALGLDDADVGRCGQLHAADLGDGVLSAALFAVDVLAVLRVCHVELNLVHDDALQAAHDLHGGDRDEDVELVRGIFIELDDGASDVVVHGGLLP